jgi:mitochondrial chaperone BCS1
MMTTNHREKLDPALLRPGRADVHVELKHASEKQMKGLFHKFYPEESEQNA